MTAFLFIPTATGASISRRVDLARFGSLFAEAEEPVAAQARGALVARLLAMLLVLVLAIGDTILVGRPFALTHASGAAAPAAAAPVTSL